MPVSITHDKKTRAVSVTVTFTADAQLDKEGLEKGVIENHLLHQACTVLSLAADQAMNPVDVAAEAAEKKAAIDAEAAAKLAASIGSSNVADNPKVDPEGK